MRFFDRASELADLREIRKRSEDVAQFTVVSGRRRVGKTSLVMKWQKVKPKFLALSLAEM